MLQFMGSQRVRHNLATKQQQQCRLHFPPLSHFCLLLWVEFPGKCIWRWNLACKNIKECPWHQQLWKEGRRRGLGKRRSQESMQCQQQCLPAPLEALELEWPIRAVLSWAEMGGQDCICLFIKYWMWVAWEKSMFCN